METCTNKQDLINIYKNEYETRYHRPFLELTLTKLGNLSDNNPVKLTENQRIDIQEKLNDNNFSNQIFYDGLDVLTFEQISYVGW